MSYSNQYILIQTYCHYHIHIFLCVYTMLYINPGELRFLMDQRGRVGRGGAGWCYRSREHAHATDATVCYMHHGVGWGDANDHVNLLHATDATRIMGWGDLLRGFPIESDGLISRWLFQIEIMTHKHDPKYFKQYQPAACSRAQVVSILFNCAQPEFECFQLAAAGRSCPVGKYLELLSQEQSSCMIWGRFGCFHALNQTIFIKWSVYSFQV